MTPQFIIFLLLGSLSVVRSEGRDFSPLTKVTNDAIQPHMAIGLDGKIYVVFIRLGNIEMSVSSDEGKTFSTPVTVIDAKGKAGGGRQRGPRIGVDAKGTVYVTDPLSRWPDLVLAVSTNGGKTFSEPAAVNDVPKQSEEALHWLAASPSGELHVAWLDRRLRGDKPGKDLAYSKVTDQGRKIHRNLVLHGPICECCAPGVAVDDMGNPTVVYREGEIRANRQIFLVASTNGGNSFTKPIRLNQVGTSIGICPMDAPAVAVTPDGKKVAVAWMDMHTDGKNRDVEWLLGAEGKFEREAVVHDVLEGQQGHPTVIFDTEGIAWCAWEDGREGSKNQRIYAISSKTRKNFRVSEASEGSCAYPILATGGGMVAIVYEAQVSSNDDVGAIGVKYISFRVLSP